MHSLSTAGMSDVVRTVRGMCWNFCVVAVSVAETQNVWMFHLPLFCLGSSSLPSVSATFHPHQPSFQIVSPLDPTIQLENRLSVYHNSVHLSICHTVQSSKPSFSFNFAKTRKFIKLRCYFLFNNFLNSNRILEH